MFIFSRYVYDIREKSKTGLVFKGLGESPSGYHYISFPKAPGNLVVLNSDWHGWAIFDIRSPRILHSRERDGIKREIASLYQNLLVATRFEHHHSDKEVLLYDINSTVNETRKPDHTILTNHYWGPSYVFHGRNKIIGKQSSNTDTSSGSQRNQIYAIELIQ